MGRGQVSDPPNPDEPVLELPLVGLSQVRREPPPRQLREFGEETIVTAAGGFDVTRT